MAAVVDADDLDRLIEAAQSARAELAAGEPPIPWDEVKTDLGPV